MENTIFGSYTKHEWKKGGKWGALVCSKSGDEKCHIPKPKRDNQKKKQQQQHTWVWIRAALYNLDSPAAKRCIMFLLPSTKDDVSANELMARWLGPPVGRPPASVRTPVELPLVSHLSGFFRFPSGEGASSVYVLQWDDVPVFQVSFG